MYYQPKTLKEALQTKFELKESGTLIAGGTDVVVGIRKNKMKVENFIDISCVPELSVLEHDKQWLHIGANVTHSQLEDSRIAALAQSARTIGGPQIRNRGTIGGQIGTASPAGDMSVTLIALKSEVELVSLNKKRRLALDEIFVGPGKTVLESDEIVFAIHVPLDRKSAFYKLGKRNAVAISLVVAAASFGPSKDVAIGLGSVAPTPLRARKTEAYLNEQGLTLNSIERAVEMVCEEVSPITDFRGGAEYRRAMSGVLVKRLLLGLAGLTGKN